jgi:DNA-binding CsgD family transcriptional regulator
VITVAETRGPSPLLERDEELRVLAGVLADCVDGHGRVALVEGPPGIGKTSLLSKTRERARSLGLTVLTARGGELEGDFGFGVVRQLLEPELRRIGREPLLEGAARLAAPVFDPDPSSAGGEPTHSVLHGLYWLLVNLAERGPLLLVVDDVHWADAASLRFLLHVARRLDGLAIALCLSARTGEHATHPEVFDVLRLEAPPPVVRPRGLSVAAVERLVNEAFGPNATRAFCDALHTASGGNPFLVIESLEQVRAEHGRAQPIDAAVIRRLASERIAAAMLLRIGRVHVHAPALTRAVAVLGEQATSARVGRLAELDGELTPQIVDALAEQAILARGEPLAFGHPIVRTAIYEDMGASRRADLHSRAAHALSADGMGEETIALHLLAARPSGDPFVVRVLRVAAWYATARGSPESAIRYLRRALEEPPAGPDIGEVLFELGQVEMMSGDAGGIERLQESLAQQRAASRRTQVARVLARSLVAVGRQAEGIAAYDQAIALLGPDDRDLALELDAEARNAARMVRIPRSRASEGVVAEAGPRAQRAALAEMAHDCAVDNGPASRAAELARRALDGGVLARESADAGPVWDAILALMVADELDEADHHLAGLLAQGRSQGARVPIAGASVFRAFNAMKRGDVARTASEAQAALDASQGGFGLIIAMAKAYLVHALIERGELEAAAEILEPAFPNGDVPDDVVFDHLLLERARYRLVVGRPRAALTDLRRLEDHVARWHRGPPRVTEAGAPILPHLPGMQYRELIALALWQLGDRDGALRAAEEELTLARSWDTPRAIGVALRARGIVESGEQGIATLTEAVAQLDRSPGRLEHARALVALGSALRRAGRRSQAREILGVGMDTAHRCGALALAETAHQELGLVGARPRRLALTGADALTASEYRVCEMAAEGATNKEIAQALFVTLRTVEGHLSNAYSKLGIRSRAELKAALRLRRA